MSREPATQIYNIPTTTIHHLFFSDFIWYPKSHFQTGLTDSSQIGI